ncbi:MAG TPA: hypothetical protein VF069_08880 [Streptosporangiaceae bacterium]
MLLVMCGFGSGTDKIVVVGARRALIVPAEDRIGGDVLHPKTDVDLTER